MITRPNTKFEGVSNPSALLMRDTNDGQTAKTINERAVRSQTTAYFSLRTDLRSKSITKSKIPSASMMKSNLLDPI
jgi:hypothetical protein